MDDGRLLVAASRPGRPHSGQRCGQGARCPRLHRRVAHLSPGPGRNVALGDWPGRHGLRTDAGSLDPQRPEIGTCHGVRDGAQLRLLRAHDEFPVARPAPAELRLLRRVLRAAAALVFAARGRRTDLALAPPAEYWRRRAAGTDVDRHLAPSQKVAAAYRDFRNWPRIFRATVRGVRLLREQPGKQIIEVDHRSDGRVVNVLHATAANAIGLDEFKRRYDGRFENRFDPVADGTRYTVSADIRPNGTWKLLLGPCLRGLVRRRITRHVLEPLKNHVEGSHV